MTFSASSMEAWCRYVVVGADDVLPSAGLERRASRFQFARPAVEFSFLLQMIWMPPADSAMAVTRPSATLVSSSWRKAVANWCFWSSKALRRAMAALSLLLGLFNGLLSGLFLGDAEGERSVPSSSRTEKSLRGDLSF